MAAAGGAVLLEGGGSLAVTNCAFERNWGHDGGAVDVKASPAALPVLGGARPARQPQAPAPSLR